MVIHRRYPALLGALAAALAVLAASCTTQAAALADRSNDWFVENSGPATLENVTPVYETLLLADALRGLTPWAVLGACIAGVSALVLLVLGARAQAGSASAAAPRDAALSRS